MALTAQQLNTVYTQVLFRPVDAGGISFFANRTDVTDAQVRQQIELSQEAQQNVHPILRLYETILNRVPESQTALAYFVGQYRSAGFNENVVAQQFLNSPEAQASLNGGVSQATLNVFYNNILGRTVDATGLDYFTKSGKGLAQVAQEISNSPEALNRTAAGIVTVLDAAAQGAPITGGQLDQVAAGGGTGGPNGGGVALSPLTPNTDNATGTTAGETLDASRFLSAGVFVNTLNNADTIDLDGGNDTVNIQLIGGTNVAPASFKNVETITLENTGAALNTLNLVNGDASLTTITVQNSGGAGANAITNLAGKISTLNIENNSSNTALTFQAGALAGATDALKVNLDNVTGAAGLNLGAGYETLSIASNGTTLQNALGAIAGTGGVNNSSITSLTLTGTQGLAINTQALVGLATIDGSAATGALNIFDRVNTNLAQNIKLGAGADVLDIATTYTTGDVIDGGAGIDRLVLSNLELNTAVIPQTNVTNVEVLSNADALAGTVTVSNFGATGFQLGANINNAATTLNFAAGTSTLNLAEFGSGGATGDLTVNIAGAATTDIVNLTTGNAVAGVGNNFGLGDLVFNGAETVNLTAVGGATIFGAAVTLTNTAANETLNINGGQNVIFNGVVTADTINASGLTGTAALQLNAGTSAQSVNVTSAGGADIITTGTANDLLNSGAGNDILTGAGGADALTGGAGNDIFSFLTRAETRGAGFNPADTTTINIDRITDFVGNGNAAGDTIQLGTAANVFGAALDFSNATTATVTAVTVQTAADFTALAAAVQAQTAGTASTDTVAQVYDVTVNTGNLAGRYAIVNDNVAAVADTDTIISITGITGALNAQDFTFAP
jgi:hypothetical protein